MADWLNKESVEGEGTNGDFLRTLIENLWKAVVELLNALGEWPIEI